MISEPASPSANRRPMLWETIFGVAMLVFLAVFRWRSISRFRIDSDEPQHLHVVWGWTRGLLPYRDFFDNHTQIFHIFYAPLLSLLGERSDIVVAMRIAELPLFALTLWFVFLLGKGLYNAQVGWWAMLLTACESTFFFTSLEFRADVLWALLWMATLLVLLTSKGKSARLVVAGLLLGATLGTSIKTALLVLSFLGAALLWVVLQKMAGGLIQWRKIFKQFFIFVAASLVIPLGLVGYFAWRGGLGNLVYCLFHHNAGTATEVMGFQSKMLIFPALILGALGLSWFIQRSKKETGLPFGKTFLLLGTAIYLGLLLSFWSLLTPFTNQDLLPFTPMLMLILAPALVGLADFLWERNAWLAPLPWVGIFGFLLPHLLAAPVDNTPSPGKYESFLAIILELTGPDDYVMDAKGEAIFRRRPYYFALETQTRRQIIGGDLPDDIPERLIATRTAVTRTNRLPDRAKVFVNQHYLRVGRGTSVLGQDLIPSPENPAQYVFEVAVPERYVIVGKTGIIMGLLDGKSYSGAIELRAGRHTFLRRSEKTSLALFWARAQEKGFSAFSERQSGD